MPLSSFFRHAAARPRRLAGRCAAAARAAPREPGFVFALHVCRGRSRAVHYSRFRAGGLEPQAALSPFRGVKSGIRTRATPIKRRMLYPAELSSQLWVKRKGFEPSTFALRCSAFELQLHPIVAALHPVRASQLARCAPARHSEPEPLDALLHADFICVFRRVTGGSYEHRTRGLPLDRRTLCH